MQMLFPEVLAINAVAWSMKESAYIPAAGSVMRSLCAPMVKFAVMRGEAPKDLPTSLPRNQCPIG